MNIVFGQSGGQHVDAAARFLVERVDEWLVSEDKPRFDAGWFHCSQLGQSDDDLIRQYRGMLPLTSHTARELRVFDLGHDRDRSWKRYLAASGLSVVGEDEARSVTINHLRLRGSLDDIAHDPNTGEWHIIEFKTMNPYQFGQLTEPKPEHLLQVTSYMAATQIDRSIILYESKGDQSVKAFYREFDHDVWAGIVKRLLRLRRAAESMDAEIDPKVVSISRELNAELAK